MKLTKRLNHSIGSPVVIVTLCLLIGAVAEGQNSLQLEDCMRWASENHPQNQKRSLLKAKFEQRTKLLNRNYYPQASFGAQASWQSDVTQVRGINFPGVEIPVPPQDQYNFSLDVNQRLWDGGVTSALKEVDAAMLEVEDRRVASSLFQLEAQVSAFYFGALLAERLRENATILKRGLREQLSKLEAAVANGTAIEADKQRLEAKIIEADQQIEEAGRKYAAALKALGVLTGKDLSNTEKVALPKVEKIEEPTIQRPELAILDAQQRVLVANQELVSARYRPKLHAFIQMGYGRPGLNYLASEFDTNAVVGRK